MKKGLQNEVQKRDSFEGFCFFFELWVQRDPRDPPRVPPGSKLLQNGSQNDSKIIKNLTCRLSENASQRRALSMFPNSSGPFFSLFLFMQREILCHIYPSKVPTPIHLAKGKNLRWMPPRCLPGASQMPLRCLSDASRCFPKKTVWGLALE